MAHASQTELHTNESEIESGIPTPPNSLQFSAIPTPPQSFLVNGNHKTSNRTSTLSKWTHRLFHANNRETQVKQNKIPQTHPNSFTSTVKLNGSTLSAINTSGVTDLSEQCDQSLNPASAGVPPTVEGLRICSHQKGKLYINPTAPIPVEMKTKWEQELNPRLIEELRRLNLDYGCADLFIAGRKQDQMAPTIAVLCTSLESKRNIGKRLKSSKLTAEFASLDIQLEILVDCNFGLKGSLDFLFSDPEFPVEVLLPETTQSLKSVLIRAKNSSSQNAVCTTLGGLVAINGKLCGLTVGHTYARGFKDMMLMNGFGRGLDRNEEQALQPISDFESDDESSVWSQDETSLDEYYGDNEELESSENGRKQENKTYDDSHEKKLQRRPSSDLRAYPKINNFENELISEREVMPSFGSAHAINTHTSSTGPSELYTDQMEKQSPEYRSPPVSKPVSKKSLTESIVSALKRPLSSLRAHSSQLSLGPAFEFATAEIARIPDDEKVDTEAALLKLEGNTKTSAQMEIFPAAPEDRQNEKQKLVSEPQNSNQNARATPQASIICSDGQYPQSLGNDGKDATPTGKRSSKKTSSETYTFSPLLKRGLSAHQNSEYHHLGSLNALGWAYDRYLPWHKMSCWIYACLYQFRTSSKNSDWSLLDLDTDIIHRLGFADRESLEALPVGRTKRIEPDTKIALDPSIINADAPNFNGFGSRVIDTDELGTVEVDVHGGMSGLQVGILNQCRSSVILMQSMFTLRQITLARVLELGDSGAWVTHKGQLCGLIVAGGGMLPFAYMLSITSILCDIRDSLGVSVSVPTDDEIDRIILFSREKVLASPVKDTVAMNRMTSSPGSPQHLSITDTDTQYISSSGTIWSRGASRSTDASMDLVSYLSSFTDEEDSEDEEAK